MALGTQAWLRARSEPGSGFACLFGPVGFSDYEERCARTGPCKEQNSVRSYCAWIQGESRISAACSTTGSLYLFLLRERNLLPWMHPLCHSIVLFLTNITAKQMYPWLFHKCKHKQNFSERCNSGFSGQICLTVRTTCQLHFSHNKGV